MRHHANDKKTVAPPTYFLSNLKCFVLKTSLKDRASCATHCTALGIFCSSAKTLAAYLVILSMRSLDNFVLPYFFSSY